MQFQSTSEDQTKLYAATLIDTNRDTLTTGPLVITLEGDMGAGKTQFAKGAAGALGISEVVSSPSYVLTREYQGERGRLIHIDCWRTPDITPEELDLASYLQPGTVVVIEWPAPLLAFLEQTGVRLIRLHVSVAGETRLFEEVA